MIFRNKELVSKLEASGQVSGQVSRQQKLILDYWMMPKSTNEIKEYLGIKSRNYVREKIIKPLIENNFLNYTNKNHINASNQKYITLKKEK